MSANGRPHSDAFVFFGASGDLVFKKIFPALYRLAARGKITMPLLVLWGKTSGQGSGYDMPQVWRDHANDVRGQAIDCGHFLPEEAPDQTYAALRRFFKGEA